MNRISVNDHAGFRADVRQRLATSAGYQDPENLAEEIHAEILERMPRRRKDREVSRLLTILDELGGEEGGP